MKMSRMVVPVFGATLLLASAAFAGAMNKGTLHLSDTVNVEGQTLKPGDYKVEWDGNGPKTEVKLVQGKNTVATFPAQVEQQPFHNAQNAYVSEPGPGGAPALTQIMIAKHDVLLNIQGNGTHAQPNQQSGK
jgi:hypothetical protein